MTRYHTVELDYHLKAIIKKFNEDLPKVNNIKSLTFSVFYFCHDFKTIQEYEYLVVRINPDYMIMFQNAVIAFKESLHNNYHNSYDSIISRVYVLLSVIDNHRKYIKV